MGMAGLRANGLELFLLKEEKNKGHPEQPHWPCMAAVLAAPFFLLFLTKKRRLCLTLAFLKKTRFVQREFANEFCNFKRF